METLFFKSFLRCLAVKNPEKPPPKIKTFVVNLYFPLFRF